MKAFKRTITGKDGFYESWYVDKHENRVDVPSELWGPDEIEIPIPEPPPPPFGASTS